MSESAPEDRKDPSASYPASGDRQDAAAEIKPRAPRRARPAAASQPFRFTAHAIEADLAARRAELFYLQKQIQSQTPMVIVLEDGEHVEGQIEWYDRNSIKVRGRTKSLVFKAAIKYMYKVGDVGR